MILKRKRSESELSSSSIFNSPPLPVRFTMMDIQNTSPPRFVARCATPSHLHSRTMKRFRDGRPSDDEVHQRTLNMLYTAQRQHIAQDQHQHHLQLGIFGTLPQPQSVTASPHPHGAHQASLHSFWDLPNAAAVSLAPPIGCSMYDGPADCEDCGQALHGNAGDGSSDAMMAGDGFGLGLDPEAATGCVACHKHVCSHCSITNLGGELRCLTCAGKKVATAATAGSNAFGWAGGVFGVRT
ncbi:hypothetical protein GGS23DRAFT_567697 [Durotheca rogersii]|uniref:uncharacterized protein n=1 Tax=Durotheca rogersii TaxID=419775 RepID=UPI00221F1191|nr:uncharacterized protein GGS23DRAFT_567697 [Durotheca rogersii]KAI5862996.1 hypothetical protein GGS23DRAFT_567697 [Durotheca rogersii]